jgi:predicted ATPase/class 3 adenylate cyclase
MRRDLPSGTVTFLFTDVEGSTRLLHSLGPEGYAEALAGHRRVIREACAAQGGVEVDTQGDAFFFAFPTAPGAVAAASVFTEALASGPIQVRVGLHTGTPLVTEEGYVGDDVHFAARVAASGHGGQVICSAATAELVEIALADLGEHRLKDIAEAVSIFQLGNSSFPPLKTTSNTNLPRPVSSFVGRKAELGEVLARIEGGARLVTLTGPGGSGKTRLAIEAASTLVTEYKAGVFWVGLASLRDPALVMETIAQTLGAKDGLAKHIGTRELLLLLDNLEQVIESAPELSALLHACPHLTLLVTSREFLRVQGEIEYAVPPLAEPEAVELFCTRSQLEPTEEITELCVRLDNLPLAVELAAARLSVLSPEQLLERLSQRLDLLKGGRDADPRQQTLRATIEWSYDLLSPEEQQLFARLSVFAGGCTLEAAGEVCDADLDKLQSLVDKSLLRFSEERFWMLETIREYAEHQLDASDERDVIEERRASFFAVLAAAAEPALSGSRGQAEWLERLDRDRLNVSAVVRWACSRNPGLALSIVADVWRYWWYRAHLLEGCQHTVAVLDADTRSNPRVRLRALEGASYLAYRRGDTAAMRVHCAEALRLAREHHDQVAEGVFVNQLSLIANAERDYERAAGLLEESVSLLEGDPYARYPLGNLALHALRERDARRAVPILNEVLAMDRLCGDEHHLCGVEGWLALALSLVGQDDEAALHARESLELAGELGADEAAAMALLVAVRLGIDRSPELAATALGGADGALERADAQRREMVPGMYAYLDSGLRSRLGDERFSVAYGQGRRLPLPEAVRVGLASLD